MFVKDARQGNWWFELTWFHWIQDSMGVSYRGWDRSSRTLTKWLANSFANGLSCVWILKGMQRQFSPLQKSHLLKSHDKLPSGIPTGSFHLECVDMFRVVCPLYVRWRASSSKTWWFEHKYIDSGIIDDSVVYHMYCCRCVVPSSALFWLVKIEIVWHIVNIKYMVLLICFFSIFSEVLCDVLVNFLKKMNSRLPALRYLHK